MAIDFQHSSIRLILEEADSRGITIDTFDDIRPGFAKLVLGEHEEYIFQSLSDLVGRVTGRILADHKVLTTHILRKAGFPVPADIVASSLEEAKAFLASYNRVVIKPLDGHGGMGITTNITTNEELERAFAFAMEHTNVGETTLVCQEHVEGRDFRVLVVGYEHIYIYERIPAFVTGDGTHTIEELISIRNKEAPAEYMVTIDSRMDAVLKSQNATLSTIPEKGADIRVAGVANLHAGGVAKNLDVTLPEKFIATFQEIARFFHTPVLGIDCLSEDITTSIGNIIEVNACPDVYKHHFPDEGPSQIVVPKMLDVLFPETASS